MPRTSILFSAALLKMKLISSQRPVMLIQSDSRKIYCCNAVYLKSLYWVFLYKKMVFSHFESGVTLQSDWTLVLLPQRDRTRTGASARTGATKVFWSRLPLLRTRNATSDKQTNEPFKRRRVKTVRSVLTGARQQPFVCRFGHGTQQCWGKPASHFKPTRRKGT